LPLAIGRASLRLCQSEDGVRLVTPKTGADHTIDGGVRREACRRTGGQRPQRLRPQAGLTELEDYGAGLVPLIVPLTLLSHYVERLGIDYLRKQAYLDLHPKELMLRNQL
jgi:hypothetical protein